MLRCMNTTQEFTVERVDDIPLLLGMMIKLGMPSILDRHLGNHGHQKGLSNGWVATIWLAYILSEGKHTKVHVQEWVMSRIHLLEQLTGQELRPEDFTDDRLTIVLKRMSDLERWHGIESELWQATLVVHHVPLEGVRLDSTTSYGYHQVSDDGVMQHGHSKDRRPDLPQLKLMLAVAEPSGQLIACDVHPGQRADDPLYLPLIRRVRQMVQQRGLLYTGDSKMAALETRAHIVAHDDYYLTVLPLTGQTAQKWDSWLDAIVDGEQTATLVWRDDELLGAGYEFTRSLEAIVDGQTIQWQERVQLVRSTALAQARADQLEKRLVRAVDALHKLTPLPGRGRRQHRDEAALQAAIDKVLTRYQVQGLLQPTWRRDETHKTRYIGPGRGGPNRPTRTEVPVHYVITGVTRDEEAITRRCYRLGWRAYVTNLPQNNWTLTDSVVHYRAGYCVERDFHLIKDKPLGLSPLYVRRSDQIVGLTHLLTIALRILILIESKVRDGLQAADATLTGLHEGQPRRATDRPTGRRLLRAFARAEVTRIGIRIEGQWHWYLTSLSDLLARILALAGLSQQTYVQLGNPP